MIHDRSGIVWMNHTRTCTHFLLSVILLAGSIVGCGITNDDRDGDALEVHLQSNFDGEHVEVEIDERTVFHDSVRTNHVIGLADVIELELPEGKHRIRIDVDGEFSNEQQFALEDRLFIGITFHRQSIPQTSIVEGIHFQFSDTPFSYD